MVYWDGERRMGSGKEAQIYTIAGNERPLWILSVQPSIQRLGCVAFQEELQKLEPSLVLLAVSNACTD